MGKIATKNWIYNNIYAIGGWSGDSQCPTKSIITNNNLLVSGSYSDNQLVQEEHISMNNMHITLSVTADVDTIPYVIHAAVNGGLVDGSELARVYSGHIVNQQFNVDVNQDSGMMTGFNIKNLSGQGISGYTFSPSSINWTKGSTYNLAITTSGYLLALHFYSGTGKVKVTSTGINTTLSASSPDYTGHVTGDSIGFSALNNGYLRVSGIQSGHDYCWSVTSTTILISNLELNGDSGLEVEWKQSPF